MESTTHRNTKTNSTERKNQEFTRRSGLRLSPFDFILEILTYPDKRLRQKAILVDESSFHTAVDCSSLLIETLKKEGGIGLAATQVGWDRRVIVIRTNRDTEPFVLINPRFEPFGNILVDSNEGCLSLPGALGVVKRYYEGTVSGRTIDNEETIFYVNKLDSIVIQHEIDHLDGILFIDRLSKLKRDLIKKKLKKKKKNGSNTFRV